MKLIDFCIRNPVTVMVGVLLSLLFGVIGLLRLPIQLIPTVDRPEITVETEYRGAAPLEVEREITDRMEEKLNAVESLKEMTSASIEGKSTVILKFDWGTNKDIARLGVSEKLDLVTELPPDAEESQVRAVNTDEESPIAWVIVETTRDLNEVWEEVKDIIVPRIERVSGVGAVWRFGGQDREVHVTLDPQAMAAREVTIGAIRAAILRENRNIKGGDLSEGKSRYWFVPSVSSPIFLRLAGSSFATTETDRFTSATSRLWPMAMRTGILPFASMAAQPLVWVCSAARGQTRWRS